MVRRAVTGLRRGMLVTLVLAGLAGFSTPALFPEPVAAGGGGGRFFTGSVHDGFGCDVCHEGGAVPRIDVEGVPVSWTAGSTYTITLRWSVPTGTVSFVGELVDEAGDGVGSLATPPSDIAEDEERCASGNLAVRLEDALPGERTVFAIPACGAEATRVQWTAPATDVGPVWLHLGVVHGDDSGTTRGDGVRMIVREIPSQASRVAADGCRAGGGEGRAPWLLALLPILRRRRRSA
jgi:hypothetical protein